MKSSPPALLLLLLLLFSTHVISQYLPLAVENATWIMVHGEEDFTINYYYAYKVEGDTTFGGQTYKKVYLYGLSQESPHTYSVNSKYLFALMRDDTTSGKVYAVMFSAVQDMEVCASDPPSEMLLYDFALSVGDTVKDCRTESIEPMYRYTIESIYTDDTLHAVRRVWHTAYSISLFEGVGYSRGLFTEATGITHAAYGTYLIDYCIGTNFECGLYTATIEPGRQADIRFFPNPVRNALQVETHGKDQEIRIYTINGCLARYSILAQSGILDVSELNPGIYFLQVADESKSTLMTRFVKL